MGPTEAVLFFLLNLFYIFGCKLILHMRSHCVTQSDQLPECFWMNFWSCHFDSTFFFSIPLAPSSPNPLLHFIDHLHFHLKVLFHLMASLQLIISMIINFIWLFLFCLSSFSASPFQITTPEAQSYILVWSTWMILEIPVRIWKKQK